MADLRLLKTFVQVARTGSMADAAAALNYTGPAVSQQMARLESDLGVSLMERSNQGIKLTPAGEVLLDRAAHVIGRVVDLRAAVVDAADSNNVRLRLNSFSSGSAHLMPNAIIRFRREFPNARLSIRDSYENDTPFDYLVSGDIDILVVYEYDHVPFHSPKGVVLHTLGRDLFDIVMSKSHPLARCRSLHLRELADEDWVLFPRRNISTLSIQHEARVTGFDPRSGSEGAHYIVVGALAGAGMGVSVLPRMVTRNSRDATYVARPLKDSAYGRTIHVATREGSNSRAVVAMRNAIATEFNRVVS